MEIDTAVSKLVSEFGDRVGLANLALDGDGALAFSLDDGATINFQWQPGRDAIWIFADLGVPPGGPLSYEGLLRGNYFWDATRGATLSLSGDEPPHVVLARTLPCRGLDANGLFEAVEAFIDTLRAWFGIIGEINDDDDDDDDEKAISDMTDYIRV